MKKLSIILAVFMMGVVGVALLFEALGFRINLADSIPVGLYRITDKGDIKNGFIIFCPDGYGYLMKKVVAIKGDIVSVTAECVFVNDRLISFSKPKSKDGINRLLPQWQIFDYHLEKNELLTMTNQSDWSFDGRYYGPVYTRQIIGAIKPIWTV